MLSGTWFSGWGRAKGCVCGGGGGGGTPIFLYIRRLGPFLGIQHFEFQYPLGVQIFFEGVLRNCRYFRGTLHNWTILAAISIHLGLFLKVKVAYRIIFWSRNISKIYLDMPGIPDIFW